MGMGMRTLCVCMATAMVLLNLMRDPLNERKL